MKLAPVRVFSCKHPLSYTFFGGNVVRVLVHIFFSLPLIFTLHW